MYLNPLVLLHVHPIAYIYRMHITHDHGRRLVVFVLYYILRVYGNL